jgi:hypothetical protein
MKQNKTTNLLIFLQDWADFDEKNKESVGIYELEHKFVSLKH